MEYVIKLGGSVLTDKSREKTLSESFGDVTDTIPEDYSGTVVHGAGSFGHPPAKRHSISEGSHTGVLETHRAIKDLNRKVIDRLRDNNLKALPVHPLSFASIQDGDLDLRLSQLEAMVQEGFTPVIHGDGVITPQKGFKALSGDDILLEIASRYDVRAGFCSSGPVLDSDGNIIEKVSSIEGFPDLGTDGTDVTGGMKAKIRKILESGTEARIFGPKDLETFLNGGDPGTRVTRP